MTGLVESPARNNTLHRSLPRTLAWACASIAVLLAASAPSANSSASLQYRLELPTDVIIDLAEPLHNDERVAEPYPFHGFAQYLNDVRYYVFNGNKMQGVTAGQHVDLSGSQTFAAVGRFNALVISGPNASISLEGDQELKVQRFGTTDVAITGWLGPKSELSALAPELRVLRYSQLPILLAWLATGMERMLITTQSITGLGWGASLIIFSVALKLMLLPISRRVKGLQSAVEKHNAELQPQIARIKQIYRGEEAHNRILSLYRARGISPFYALRPLLGVLVQMPVLIAVFHALGEMEQFAGAKFLWIKDLAKPDSLIQLGFSIRYFGDSINALPILMFLIAACAAIRYAGPHGRSGAVARKRLQLLAMGIIFFILFYPFPAAISLYWLLASLPSSINWVNLSYCSRVRKTLLRGR